MSHTRYRYVGRDALPKRLSPTEVETYFTLTPALLKAVEAGADRKYRLALAAQVAFLGATGSHPASTDPLPVHLMKGLCSQLGISETAIASIASINKTQRTVWEHRRKAREILGMTLFDEAEHLPKVRSVLAMHAFEAANIDELEVTACRALFDANVVIPADRVVRAAAVQAFATIYTMAEEAVGKAVEPQWFEAIVELMFKDSVKPGATVLEWLKSFTGKHAPMNLKEVTQKIDYLKSLRVHEWNLSAISFHRLRAFALSIQGRAPSETAKRDLKKLKLPLVCFLKYQLMLLTDETIYRASRRTSDLRRKGKDSAKQVRAARGAEYRRVLEKVHVTVGDKKQTEGQRLKQIDEMVLAILGQSNDTIEAIVRDFVSSVEQEDRVQSVLDAFTAIDLDAANASKDLKVIKELTTLRDSKATVLPEDFDSRIVDPAWRDLVDSEDRELALRAFMAHAMERIRDCLSGGKMWVDYSGDYRSREDCLIPKNEWDARKEEICEALGLELDPDKFLEAQLGLLEDGLVELSKQLESGMVEVDPADGGIKIARLRAAEEEPKLNRTQAELDKQIGEAQLSDVIVELDRHTGFSEALLARRAKSREELLGLYGGLIAGATGISAKGVASMIPGLKAVDVSSAMRMLELKDRVLRANSKILDFQQRQPVVKSWGDGSRASSDMMALDATRHLAHARQNPRRKTMSAGMYTMKLDRYVVGYGMPIVQNTWQDGPAVHSVFEYNNALVGTERTRIELSAVDTHGFSFVGMSVAKLLGFDLYPQLANLKERALFVPNGFKTEDKLDANMDDLISKQGIALGPLKEGWPEAMRFVASARQGKVSVNWLISRNGGTAKGEPAYRTFMELGKLLRTIFLCDFYTNVELRREIHTLLNRGEAVHVLQRAIFPGRIAPERGRRRDELGAMAGALVLLTNIVIAFNTLKLQQAFDALRAAGQVIGPEIQRRISPVRWAEINFRGRHLFDFGEHEEHLIAKPAGRTERKAAG